MQQLSPDIIKYIAQQGQNGDTEIGHLTKQDIVVPAEAPAPIRNMALQGLATAGFDPSRYTVGTPSNDINSSTGMMAFDGEGGDGAGRGDGPAGDGTGGTGGADGSGGSTGGTVGEGGGVSATGGTSGTALGEHDSAKEGAAPGGLGGAGGPGDSGGSPGGVVGATGVSGPVDANRSSAENTSPNPTGADDSGLGFNWGGAVRGLMMGSPVAAAMMGVSINGKSLAEHASNLAHEGLAALGGGTPAPEGHDFAGRDAAQPQDVLNGQNVGGQPGKSGGATGGNGFNANNQNSITQGNVGQGVSGDITDLGKAQQSIMDLGKSSPFGPGSTFGQDIIRDILSQQHNTADQSLQNAFRRGTLSDLGLNTAEQQLGNQDAQASSRTNTISGNLLANYQQQLQQAQQADLQAAQGTSATNPFQLDPVAQQFQQLISQLQGGYRGDLLNDLPTNGLYDVPTLIAAGGNSQGLYNPGGAQASPIMSALSNQRGIGTTGEF